MSTIASTVCVKETATTLRDLRRVIEASRCRTSPAGIFPHLTLVRSLLLSVTVPIWREANIPFWTSRPYTLYGEPKAVGEIAPRIARGLAPRCSTAWAFVSVIVVLAVMGSARRISGEAIVAASHGEAARGQRCAYDFSRGVVEHLRGARKRCGGRWGVLSLWVLVVWNGCSQKQTG